MMLCVAVCEEKHMTIQLFFRASLWRIIVVGCLVAFNLNAVKAAEIQEILATWETRQSQVNSARFEWDFATFIPASGANPALQGPMGGGFGGVVDAHVAGKGSISFEGTQVRSQFDEPNWLVGRNTPIMRNMIVAKNATSLKRYSPGTMEIDSRIRAVGFIEAPDQDQLANHVQFLPITRIYRPLSNSLVEKYPTESFKVLQPDVKYEGHNCVIIGNLPSDRDYAYNIVVENRAGFFPLNIKHYVRGKLSVEASISYDSDLPTRLPKSWTVHVHRSDKTLLKIDAKVTFATLDPRFNETEFDFDFPSGTWVTDLTVKPEASYLVTDKGKIKIDLNAPRKPKG